MIRTIMRPTPAPGRRRANHARPRAVGPITRFDRNRAHGVRLQAHSARHPVLAPLRAVWLAALATALILSASPLIAPGAHAAAPRVVIVVGPAGEPTSRYRADGDAAAEAARAAGADVTTIYSPNATWPKVKAALQGASIVVYMGHGNGFPSRYGPVLRKETKNGIGLNPVAGVDDVAHQYFGEAYLARQIRLAPHAVVLLHHLCYASGNSEPGLPEGDLETAKQRVDNMAAGWLAAGAEAVVADAYGHPAHYIRQILRGKSTIEEIWRSAPTAHGHVLAFPSSRTPGMTGLMDPTRKSSGFYRSLVVRAKMRADEVAAGAISQSQIADMPGQPRAAPSAPAVSQVSLEGRPTVGAVVGLSLALEDRARATSTPLRVGVRWDPITVDDPALSEHSLTGAVPPSAPAPTPTQALPAATPTSVATTSGASPAPPAPQPSTTPPAQAASLPAVPAASANLPAVPAASANLPAVPALVTPEALGDVVVLVDTTHADGRLSANVTVPRTAGLYRLVSTLHDADGVALVERAGHPIPALLVRVRNSLSAVIAASSRVKVKAGVALEIPVAVMNSGTVPWVAAREVSTEGPPQSADRSRRSAILVGYWLLLGRSNSSQEASVVRTVLDAAPGVTTTVSLRSTAPHVPGEYLLVLDVISAIDGSVIAAGGESFVVHVTVLERAAVGAS